MSVLCLFSQAASWGLLLKGVGASWACSLWSVFREELVRGWKVRIVFFFLSKHLEKKKKKELWHWNKPSEVIPEVKVKFFHCVESILFNVCFNYRRTIKETCEGCSFCDLMIAALWIAEREMLPCCEIIRFHHACPISVRQSKLHFMCLSKPCLLLL